MIRHRILLPIVAVFFLALLPSDGDAECPFLRGDGNLDGVFDLSDGVRILNIVFLGFPRPDCEDVLDANDDGGVDLSDAVYLLGYIFNGTTEPPAPFPDLGHDLTDDPFVCNLYDASVSCLDPAGFEAALSAADVCILAGAAPIVVSLLSLEVVPVTLAQPCGDPPRDGWPVELTVAEASVDIPGETLQVSGDGVIEDMPVVAKTIITTDTCSVDVTFEADVVLQFATISMGEMVFFTGFESVEVNNATLNVSATGGTLCSFGAALVTLLDAFIVAQLVGTLEAQLVDFNVAIGCRKICPGP